MTVPKPSSDDRRLINGAEVGRRLGGLRSVLAMPGSKAIAGTLCLLALIALGLLTRTTLLASRDLHVDKELHAHAFLLLTIIATFFTTIAQEAVGVGLLVVGLVVLLIRRRRWDATRLLLMAGASWALAVLVKHFIERARPPASLGC